MIKHLTAHALAGTALLCLGTHGALALDGDDFSAKLSRTLEVMGFVAIAQTSRVDGDTIILSDFTVGPLGQEPRELLGDVTFEGVSETGDGGYTVEVARVDDIAVSDEEMAFSMHNIEAQGITIPAQTTLEAMMEISYGFARSASAGPVELQAEGEAAMSIERLEFWSDPESDVDALRSGFALTGMMFNPAIMPQDEEETEQAMEVFDAFGLERIVANFSGAGTWFTQEGRLTVDDLLFEFEDLGALTVNAALTGYTREFYQEVLKTSLKLGELGPDATPQETAEIEDAMIAKMLELEIETISIRYDDDSLVPKALEFAGAEQGIDGPTMANGLKFMVPMMLMEVGNAQFSSMVGSAVNAFLDNPQNFEIVVAPTQPLGIGALETLEADPGAVIDLLNLDIRANQ